MKKKILKKKNNLISGNLFVKSSLKNTIISLTNIEGKVTKQWSTKSLKKTKQKRNNPYNIQIIIYKINKYIKIKKIKRLNIYLNGSGLGRYHILKNLKKKPVQINAIIDKTPFPFNGCRKKKKKRL